MLLFAKRPGGCILPLTGAATCDLLTFFDSLLVAAIGLSLLLAALMAGYSLSSWRMKTNPYNERNDGRTHQWLYLMGATGFLVLSAWLLPRAVTLPPTWSGLADAQADLRWFIAFLASFLLFLAFAAVCIGPRLVRSDDDNVARKYARRRYQEGFSGALLLAIAALLVIGTVPVLPAAIASALPWFPDAPDGGLLPLFTYLVALATALFGFYRTNLRGTLGIGSAFVVVAGSAFVCWSALLVSYQVAQELVGVYRSIPAGAAEVTLKQAAWLVAPLVALALGFFANINDVSLGRFYRDRLMEAFMPDERCIEDGSLRAAGDADRFKLTEILAPVRSQSALANFLGNGQLVADEAQAKLLGPYPLINANVMTPWHADPVLRARGGDNFVLAPAYCGSSTTGWKPTTEMMRGRMPLATAMAISGAAANPRGGFAGTGPTTSYVVAVAMSLLSVRLGYWLRWNSVPPIRSWLNPFGNHFVPSAVSLVPRHSSTFVELTDGGHFENLGVYELVRRRCGLIIVCDGGDDRMATYASLTESARRIEEDFGVTFAFDFKVRNETTYEDSGPQHVVARQVGDDYPKDAEYSSRGYFLASIRYPDAGQEQRVPMASVGPKAGLLIYLKSAMIRSLSLTSRGYKGANAEFPYESTADQFFSPEQFEAYRDVGVRIAKQMLEDTNLKHLFDDGERPSLWSLRSTYGFTTSSSWEPWERPSGKDTANGKAGSNPKDGSNGKDMANGDHEAYPDIA